MSNREKVPRISRKTRLSDGRTNDHIVLDTVDEALIAELRQSARIGHRDLARLVGVNEATVRTRLRRLESENVVRIVAIQDLNAMSYDAIAAVGVQVKGRSAIDVGEELARIENIITVNVTIGAFDLEIQVIARDTAELDYLLTDVIAQIEGVERLFPGLSMRIVKYDPEWVPL